EQRQHISAEDAKTNADQAPDFAEHNSLHDELRHDVALLGTHGAADSDLARAFGDRDEHDIHDANSRSEKRDGTHQRNAYPHGASEIIELRNHGVVGKNFEIVFLAGSHFANDSQCTAHLLECGVVTAGIARLHEDIQAARPAPIAIQPGGDG